MKCRDHEKRKTTFTIRRTACVGGLPDYSCTVVSASIFFFSTIILFSFIYLFFVQTSTNVFVGYTNAALMRFAAILKVPTIALANMDSREMDENVKVGVGFITNYVMKKIKLAFANYPQRGGKKMYRETERENRYI